MDVAHPHSAVSPSLEGDVLVVLAGTTRPLTGREVARLAHRGSPPAIAAALNRLVSQGLVQRQEAGRAFLHTLNRVHLAAPAALALAGLRGQLIDRLRTSIGSWEIVPVSAAMFGSAARGDGDTESDIDLLVVRSAQVDEDDHRWRSQLRHLADDVHAWTGNHAGIIEMAEEDLRHLVLAEPPVVEDLRTEAIPLVGVPPAQLLRRET